MQRTKKVPSGQIRWIKTGGGSFRMANGRIIKPNQTFYAKPEDIPKGFRDLVKPLDDLPEEAPIKSITVFEMREHSDGGFFDVVNAKTGKKMNENPLDKETAEIMLRGLL